MPNPSISSRGSRAWKGHLRPNPLANTHYMTRRRGVRVSHGARASRVRDALSTTSSPSRLPNPATQSRTLAREWFLGPLAAAGLCRSGHGWSSGLPATAVAARSGACRLDRWSGCGCLGDRAIRARWAKSLSLQLHGVTTVRITAATGFLSRDGCDATSPLRTT
jgi:hypothetical protein